MKNQPLVDVIVLNWNARLYLPECLSSLLASSYFNNTINLVDNDSDDDSVAYVSRHFPNVNIIEAGENIGFARGNNLGLRQTNAPFVVLLNPDVFVTPAWLEKIIMPLQQSADVGIVGSKLYYPDGQTIQHAGGYLTPPRALPGHYGVGEVDAGLYDGQRDVEYVIGAAMALRRDMLDQIGLLDETFFLYFEDADLCYRARAAGYRVIYEPKAVAIHMESATTVKGSPDYLHQFHRGRWLFMSKHYEPAMLLNQTVPAEQEWLAALPPAARGILMAVYRELAEVAPLAESAAALLAAETDLATTLFLPWQVEERPFTSPTPLIGPLIARLRTLWNNIATKWYVRPLIQQQNEINWHIVHHLQAITERQEQILQQQQIIMQRQQFQDERLIAQDQDQTHLFHDTAEITAHLIQLKQYLDEQSDET